MAQVQLKTQLAIRLQQCFDALSQVTALFAAEEIHILASHACECRGETGVLAIVDDGVRAQEALSAAGYEYTATTVVLLPLKERSVIRLHLNLHDAGVDVLYSYRCFSNTGDKLLVMRTSNDPMALRILQTCLESKQVPARKYTSRPRSAAA